MRKPVLLLAVLAALGYLATGVYMIQPDEQGVVRRFGKLSPVLLSPGVQFELPWGLARVDRVRPAETKQIAIGAVARADELQTGAAALRASEFLTGDQNIIHVQTVAQYRIADPKAYVLHCANATGLVASVTEAALAEAAAAREVDSVLTEGRDLIQTRVLRKAQQMADELGLGVAFSSVNIVEATPPLQVADAFLEAQNARSDRDRIKNEAESYRNRVLARTTSEVREMVDQATAYRDRSIQTARGESDRFLALLYEYRKAKAVTAMRLYLEVMEAVLPRLEAKLVVDPGERVDLGILRAND